MHLLIILMFVAFFTDVFQVFAIGTYGVKILDILTLIFYILILKRIIWNGDNLIVANKLIIFFLLLLLTSAFISGLTPLMNSSTNLIIQHLKTSSHFIFLLLFALVIALYPVSHRVWTDVIKVWLFLSIFINLFGIYQIIARAYDLPLAWIDITNVSFTNRGKFDLGDFTQISLKYEDFYRATSIFPEPSTLATFNLYIITFIYIPYIRGNKQFLKSKILSWLIFIISIVTLFLTFSLSAFIGIFLVFIAVIIFQFSKKLIRLIPILITTLIMVLISDFLVQSFTNISLINLFSQRISSVTQSKESGFIAGESYFGRLENAKRTVEIWKKNPVIGSGMGLIGYDKDAEISFSDIGALSLLAETGILGFLGLCGLFIILFIKTGKFLINYKYYTNLDNELQRLLGILFYIVLIQFLINFFVGNNVVGIGMWYIIAIVISNINNIAIQEGNIKIIQLMNEPMIKKFGTRINSFLANLNQKSKE